MQSRMTTPNRLKELRLAQGLVLRELAKVLGVDIRTVHRHERGESEVPDAMKVRYAAIFGVSVPFFMRWDS